MATLKSAGPRLQLNLVPKGAPIYSVRLLLCSTELAGISARARAQTKSVCVTCGGHAVSFDEVFTYHGTTQALAGFIAVCTACERARRFQATEMGGHRNLQNHLSTVNRWGDVEVLRYIRSCLSLYAVQSKVQWQPDLSKLADWIPASKMPKDYVRDHPFIWATDTLIDAGHRHYALRKPCPPS